MPQRAYIGFGANLGDRRAKFRETLKALEKLESTYIVKHSSLYETKPIGISDGGPEFLNAAIVIATDLEPLDLIREIRTIELKLGKSPSHRSDLSRPIDLDLLLYGNEIISMEGFEIPHPRMHLRALVLAPLAEIDDAIWHPKLKCTIGELLSRLSDEELKEIRPTGFD